MYLIVKVSDNRQTMCTSTCPRLSTNSCVTRKSSCVNCSMSSTPSVVLYRRVPLLGGTPSLAGGYPFSSHEVPSAIWTCQGVPPSLAGGTWGTHPPARDGVLPPQGYPLPPGPGRGIPPGVDWQTKWKYILPSRTRSVTIFGRCFVCITELCIFIEQFTPFALKPTPFVFGRLSHDFKFTIFFKIFFKGSHWLILAWFRLHAAVIHMNTNGRNLVVDRGRVIEQVLPVKTSRTKIFRKVCQSRFYVS